MNTNELRSNQQKNKNRLHAKMETSFQRKHTIACFEQLLNLRKYFFGKSTNLHSVTTKVDFGTTPLNLSNLRDPPLNQAKKH